MQDVGKCQYTLVDQWRRGRLSSGTWNWTSSFRDGHESKLGEKEDDIKTRNKGTIQTFLKNLNARKLKCCSTLQVL